ncbi:hypothetical protein K450DRAFT_219311 [Umbelopsis ramanniana AG]|uniref:DUF3074 domain-containing protein n=1 Tax=Umbelopsis ramanniana AG TaxID=1314678 RepID=A0AAD5EI88_UMBRA|nr:uncharacterized protein K450DRAFT_219311 [Umbelopsis ramanniana AG]KAI8584323.1 hypothetical protein K450DRAFT_219311 [Umbelopsis ramanniana AG]
MVTTISRKDLPEAGSPEFKSMVDGWFADIDELVKNSRSWPVVNTTGEVVTRRKQKEASDEGNHYFQRESTHFDITYEGMRSLLYVDHSLQEPKYINMCEGVELIEEFEPQVGIYWIGFKVPFASREFVELVATREEGRAFFIVSKGVDHPSPVKSGHVRGEYDAWEIVREVEVDGKKGIEWVCIQHSSAGGNLPKWIVDAAASKDFHKDVGSAIEYVKTHVDGQ